MSSTETPAASCADILSMLVARELEIQNFKPKDYWVVKGKFNSEHGSYEGTHVVKKFDKESDADEILRKLSADTGPATVKSIKEKSFWREKPYLYSLQGLQMDANKVYGFSLQHTLDLAQSLYEKGFTTYPRTDSSHLTDDMGPEMKKVIQMLFSSDIYPIILSLYNNVPSLRPFRPANRAYPQDLPNHRPAAYRSIDSKVS